MIWGTAGPVRAGFNNPTMAPGEEYRALSQRGGQCSQFSTKFLLASPSFHGGRGALPSDLTFLSGGGVKVRSGFAFTLIIVGVVKHWRLR